MQEKPTECPYCRSKIVWKSGILPSVRKGKRQRYKCGDCGKTWYNDSPIMIVVRAEQEASQRTKQEAK